MDPATVHAMLQTLIMSYGGVPLDLPRLNPAPPPRNVCTQCHKRIPPGRPGRKCETCRVAP